MTLDELIKELETAIELGDSDEEWTAGDFDVHAGKWKRATGSFKGTAQAIAIRHNTADSVLKLIKLLKALCKQAADEMLEDSDERIPDTPTMLRVGDGTSKCHKCECGANVFAKTIGGNYSCNGCLAVYEGKAQS